MPMLALKRKCLILNADFRPLATWPLSLIGAEEAVTAVVKGTVNVLAEWPEAFRSPSTSIRVPKAAALREYVPIDAEPKFCRRSILLRDRFRCQFCGKRFEAQDLTFDHVIPRAAGGKTVWENILMACADCNARKRDSLPNWSGRKLDGLRPLKPPRKPITAELFKAGLEFLDPQVKEEYREFLYWNVELEA